MTVRRAHGKRVTYDPGRLQGVTLCREADRAFATGHRVQLTAPDRERHLANRELGTIESMPAKGDLRLRLDSGRTVALNLREHSGLRLRRHEPQQPGTDTHADDRAISGAPARYWLRDLISATRRDGSHPEQSRSGQGIIEMLKPLLFEVSLPVKRRFAAGDHLPRRRRHQCGPRASRRREHLAELSRLLVRLRKNGPFEIWRDEEMGLGAQGVEFGLDGFE
jgi:hypothetical protein